VAERTGQHDEHGRHELRERECRILRGLVCKLPPTLAVDNVRRHGLPRNERRYEESTATA